MKKLLARFLAWVSRVLRGRPDDQAVPGGGGGGGLDQDHPSKQIELPRPE
ncbi:hypothetical protein ACU5AX_09070 [Sphingomonas sp. XXL09]